mgnify:CR=1 FL=1
MFFSTKIRSSDRTRLIGSKYFDQKSLFKSAWKSLSRFDRRVSRILLQYHCQVACHRVFRVESAKLLIYVWPSGELLAMPIIDDTVLVHHHQHNWLKYYPFIRFNNGNPIAIDFSQFIFQTVPSHDPAYLLVGRDHWGHFVIDFLSRYSMSMECLHSSFSSCLHSISMPLSKNHSSIQSLYSCASHKNLTYLPVPKVNSILELNDIIVSDNTPPLPFLSGMVSSQLDNWPHDAQSRIGFINSAASASRMFNYNHLIAAFISNGIDLIDPLSAYDNGSAQKVYSSYTLIIAPHGSAMLNPLIFTKCKIIGLFPKLLFSSYAHFNDISQYSDIALLFNSRIFPVFGEPVNFNGGSLGVNQSIEYPHKYNINSILIEIQRLLEP